MNQNQSVPIATRNFIFRVVFSGWIVAALALLLPPINFEIITGTPRYITAIATWLIVIYPLVGKVGHVLSLWIIAIFAFGLGGTASLVLDALFGLPSSSQLPVGVGFGTILMLLFYYVERRGTPDGNPGIY